MGWRFPISVIRFPVLLPSSGLPSIFYVYYFPLRVTYKTYNPHSLDTSTTTITQ